jgi:hypothetical protein
MKSLNSASAAASMATSLICTDRGIWQDRCTPVRTRLAHAPRLVEVEGRVNRHRQRGF